MTIDERYTQGDSVIDIAESEDVDILHILSELRRTGTINTAGPTVSERLDQDIHKFLDAYFLDELKVSSFGQKFSIDDNRRRLSAAYIYRILDELQINRRRKNNKLPRLKRTIIETAIEEYQSGRTFYEVLMDPHFSLNLAELLTELKQRQLFRKEDAITDLDAAIQKWASEVTDANVTRDL